MSTLALSLRHGSLTLAAALLWLGLIYNVAEGVIAVSAGALVGSVALLGFGLDSFIEVTASAVLLWRLSPSAKDRTGDAREQVARRIVGATFIALATYIVAQAAYVLATGSEPGSSRPGIALALVSLALMPALGIVKLWNARRLHSHALMAEAGETLVCSYLSATLFAGLALNAALGWWWADIAAAAAMVPWIVKEGVEGLRADACGGDCPPEASS